MSSLVNRIRSNQVDDKPVAYAGYEHINRYWDRTNDCHAAKILPGEYYVTGRGELITTVLGSCISACIRDKNLGIGGMNHFMLPHSTKLQGWGVASSEARYGSYAMEVLINDILMNGGRRANLEVKLFGGGNVLAQVTSIGQGNINFALEYVRTENLALIAEDMGGICPRKVIFYPDSGRVQVKKLRSMHNDTVLQREKKYQQNLDKKPATTKLELF